MTKTIAVDFDGVIHTYSRGWADGSIYDPPIPGAIDGLRLLMQHCAVFVHTTRKPWQVAHWLREHDLPAVAEAPADPTTLGEFWDDQTRLLVTNRKLPAIAYIDDRAIRFHDWDDVHDEVQFLLTHGRPAQTDAGTRS